MVVVAVAMGVVQAQDATSQTTADAEQRSSSPENGGQSEGSVENGQTQETAAEDVEGQPETDGSASSEDSGEPEGLIIKGDPVAGAELASPCAACHGPGGNSSNPAWPKLAGQGALYIYQQLQAFKSGARQDPLMTPQAANLSDQDIKDLAVFFAQQQRSVGVAQESRIELGQRIYRAGDKNAGVPACMGCHGPAGRGNPAAGYPMIGGQHEVYLESALRAYRADKRTDSDRAKIMQQVAARLTEQELKAVASYVSGLH